MYKRQQLKVKEIVCLIVKIINIQKNVKVQSVKTVNAI